MHKVILLGGGGFIGNALARALTISGNDVLVLNRAGRCAVPGVLAHRADRGQPAQVLAAARGFGADILIDMIAFELPDTRALLAVLEGQIGRYVLISSCDVYAAFGRVLGTQTGVVDNLPLDESAPLRAKLYPFRGLIEGRYAYDKIPLETLALQQSRPESVIVRLPMVFGPDDPRRRYHRLADMLRAGKAEITMEAGFARWVSPHVQVEDVGRAIAMAAVHKGTAGQVMNIGPDEHFSEAERARIFARAIGKTLRVKTRPANQGDCGENYHQHIVLNSDCIRRITGWAPQMSFERAFQNVWHGLPQALTR